jgi:HEAT repeat protein
MKIRRESSSPHGRVHRGVVWTLLSLVCLGPDAATAGLPPQTQPRERWAIFVSDHAPGVAAVQDQIAQALQTGYGYHSDKTFHLHQDASRGAILDRLAEVLGRMGAGDTLLVHFALTTANVNGDLYLVPSDGNVAEPWTLVAVNEIEKLARSSPLRSALILYPSCNPFRELSSGSNSPSQSAFQGSLPRRGPSITYIGYCPPTRSPEAGALDFSEALRAVIQEGATRDTPTTASALAASLSQSLPGYSVQVSRPSLEEFSLSPQRGRLGPVLARLADAATPEARISAIDEVVKAVLTEVPEHRGPLLSEVRAPLLARVNDPQEDLTVRIRAVTAFGDLADREAVLTLGPVYSQSPTPDLRKATLEATSRIGGPAAVRMMEQALSDESPIVRASAIRSLGYLAKDTRSSDSAAAAATYTSILEHVKDPDPAVKIAALQVCAQFPAHAGETRSEAMNLLGDGSAQVRRETLSTLTALGRGTPAARILPILRSDTDPSVRQAAALTLVRTFEDADRAAVESGLLASSQDPDPGVQEASAWALGELGGPAAEARLMKVVQNQGATSRVRRSAAEGLGKIHSKASVPVLIEALKGKDPEVKQGAAAALGVIGDPRAIDPLLAALKDSNTYVRLEAEKALKNLKGAPVGDLAAKLNDPSPRVRAEAVQKLSEGGSHNAALIEALGDDDDTVQQAAIDGLTRNRNDQLPSQLAQALESKNPRVRQGAAQVLGRLGQPAEAQRLIAHASDSDPAVRSEVIRSLGQLRDQSGEQTVLQAVKDSDPHVRRAAAEGLGIYLTPAAIQGLRELSGDSDPGVREAALAALRNVYSKK